MGPRSILMIAMSVVSLPGTAVLADDAVLAPYHADYSLALHGVGAGESRFSLAPDGNGKYLYRATAHTTGLGALLKPGFRTSQESHFDLADGRVHPLSYHYMQQDGDDKQSQSIVFDWTKRSAHTEEDGHQKDSALAAGTYDVFLIQLALAMDVEGGHLANGYKLLDHGETNDYATSRLRDQKMRVDRTELDTMVLQLHSATKGRTIKVWLAPALHYLPVKIEQDKPAMTLTLDDISFETEPPAAATGK